MDTTIIRPLGEADIPAASQLVQRVFDRFEAPDYPPEGIATFHRFTAPEVLAARLRDGGMQAWGAYCSDELIGVLATRERTHISLLFIDAHRHRQGIGRALFDHLRTVCSADPACARITVNSAPFPIGFYRKLGFIPTDRELTVDGIRFTPMEFPL